MLRQLAIYHSKDANNLFCVRLAQGLTHLGKGTLTLCPYHSDRQIMAPVSVAGLMAFLVSCLNVKNSKWLLEIFVAHYIACNAIAVQFNTVLSLCTFCTCMLTVMCCALMSDADVLCVHIMC